MSQASITRQYAARVYNPETNRLSEKGIHWSYGQAMNSASRLAEQKPDHIVFLETRVVIVEDWEEVDHEAEEYRQEQKRIEREQEASREE